MAESPARTLADHLRGWSAEELTRLLTSRPDLAANPTPTDSAQLAARAATRSSVAMALDGLDQREIGVLEAVANGQPSAAHTERLDDVLASLAQRLLIWHDGRSWRALNAVADVLALPPGPEDPRPLIDELDARETAILRHLEESDADGTVEALPARLTLDTARTPTERLVAMDLLAIAGTRRVRLPWSVRVALREGRSTRESLDEAPTIATRSVDATLVDRMAAGAAFEFVRRTEVLLDRWGSQPPVVLRSGGLGVRDLRAAAVLLHVEPDEAVLVIETAAAAGLVAAGITDDLDSAWLPTDAFDSWLDDDVAERWTRLARAWLAADRDLGRVTGATAGERVNALADGIERGWLAPVRRTALAELAALPPGEALAGTTGVPSLLARMTWQRPRRARWYDDAVRPQLDQAAVIGVTGRDALSTHGRALLAGDDPTATLADLLPAPVDHVLLQADLTAIAPGPLERDLARRLALVADVDSRGGATVYRFDTGSVRRAFDAGCSTAEVHDFVAATSRTPVPQALTYLIDDVARRFGVLRAGVAESFLRTDDETALTELLHQPEAAPLRLRRIAPTVAISDMPLDLLLPRLRAIGQAPVVEALDGTVHVARPDQHRTRTPRPPVGSGAARAIARTSAVVAAVQAGDRAAASRPPRLSESSPAEVITLLRASAETGASVTIRYVGNDGTVAERLVRPLRVEGGRLTAYDDRSDGEREFAVHRITAVARA